ncbi:MAG TPA: hypothetical protein VGG38_03970 [Acidimicrobiales bacterium]|jgi:hypothetical protein
MGQTEPNDATLDEERVEASSEHDADRPPTEDEEREAALAKERISAAEAQDVAEHYEEMTRLGANDKGEGRID